MINIRREWLLGYMAIITGCGNVGNSDETVSLAPVGLDVTLTVPTGGKVEKSSVVGEPEINWKGLNWHASLRVTNMLSGPSRALAVDEHGTFDARTPVVIQGKSYTCWVTAKTEAEAKRVQPACDALAKASPKIPDNSQAAAAPAIELEEKTVPGIGSKIKLPKGAKTLDENEYTATYSLTLPDGVNELNVSVNKAGAASLDDAKRMATMLGGTIASAKALPSGMLEIVLAPEATIQTVSTSSGKFGAKCAGPTSYLPKLIEMCESLVAPGATASAKAASASPGTVHVSASVKKATMTGAKPVPAKATAPTKSK